MIDARPFSRRNSSDETTKKIIQIRVMSPYLLFTLTFVAIFDANFKSSFDDLPERGYLRFLGGC